MAVAAAFLVVHGCKVKNPNFLELSGDREGRTGQLEREIASSASVGHNSVDFENKLIPYSRILWHLHLDAHRFPAFHICAGDLARSIDIRPEIESRDGDAGPGGHGEIIPSCASQGETVLFRL